VSAVLLQNAFETTSPFTDAGRLRDFPPRLAVYRLSIKQSLLLCKQTVDGLFPSFNTLLLSILLGDRL